MSNNNSLMLAIIGTLRPVPAVTSGVAFVAACTPAIGTTSGTQNLGIPAGAQVGDVVVMAFTNDSAIAPVAIPSGASQVVPRATYMRATGGAPVQCSFSGYVKRLTSGDITAGSLAFNFGAGNSSVLGAVYRNVSESLLSGTPGTNGAGAPVATPVTFTSPGTTTDAENCMLVSWGIVNPASIAATLIPPDGFTQAYQQTITSAGTQWIGHALQVSSGASGTQTYSDSGNLFASAGYGAWTLALRPKVSAIALAYTLPATATVGTAYSGSITATLVDGATGPVTITATSLPAGVTAGTLVDNGDGTYTLPVSGTPTTAQTANVEIGATNGTQSASASASVVVSATASSVVIKASNGNAISSGSPPALVPVTLAVTAGDQITVMYSASGTFNAPFKPAISDTAGNVYTMLTPTLTGASANQIIWTAIANATGTITISAKGAWYYGYECIEAYATTPATYSTPTGVSVSSSTSWDIALPSTPPAGSLALVGVRFPAIAYTTPGLTEDVSSYVSGLNAAVSIAHVVAPVSTALGSYKFASNASGNYTTLVLSPK